MDKTLIVGLNSNLKNIVGDLDGEILVIDEMGLKHAGQYTTFESDNVLSLYQASLVTGRLEHDDFSASQEFYEHLYNQQHELEYMNLKDLQDYLSAKNIKVLKGRLRVVDANHAELTYLGETTSIEFDKLILNTGFIEENPTDSPFVFTFNQFLNTGQLFRRILVDAKSLRGLEIAGLLARFGCEVTLVSGKALFSEIDHLMFRDAVRESIVDQGINHLEKYTIESIEDLDNVAKVHVKPLSQLAFEITNQVKEQTIEVDAIVIESDPTKPSFVEGEEDLSKPLRQHDSVFLNPVLASVKTSESGVPHRFDAQEFTYFKTRFEIDGGIELLVKDEFIIGGTFYCHNALELAQLLELIKHIPVGEIQHLSVFENSLLGVFKEAATKILEKDDQNGR